MFGVSVRTWLTDTLYGPINVTIVQDDLSADPVMVDDDIFEISTSNEDYDESVDEPGGKKPPGFGPDTNTYDLPEKDRM